MPLDGTPWDAEMRAGDPPAVDGEMELRIELERPPTGFVPAAAGDGTVCFSDLRYRGNDDVPQEIS